MGYKSSTTITKIEKEINDVTQTTIKKFADALFTTPSYLMGWTEIEPEPMPEPQLVAYSDKYTLLDDEDKKIIMEHIDFLLSKDKYQKRESSVG